MYVCVHMRMCVHACVCARAVLFTTGKSQLLHCGKFDFVKGSIHENTASRCVFLFHYFMPQQQSHNTGVLNGSLSNHSAKCALRRTRHKQEEWRQSPDGQGNQRPKESANHLVGLMEGKENFPYLMNSDLP